MRGCVAPGTIPDPSEVLPVCHSNVQTLTRVCMHRPTVQSPWEASTTASNLHNHACCMLLITIKLGKKGALNFQLDCVCECPQELQHGWSVAWWCHCGWDSIPQNDQQCRPQMAARLYHPGPLALQRWPHNPLPCLEHVCTMPNSRSIIPPFLPRRPHFLIGTTSLPNQSHPGYTSGICSTGIGVVLSQPMADNYTCYEPVTRRGLELSPYSHSQILRA